MKDIVKKIRNELGLDQTAFAVLIGVKPSAISNYEAGYEPSYSNAVKIMKVGNEIGFNITIEMLKPIKE
jgi:transcriptional regulator with XRE-family HTH domain